MDLHSKNNKTYIGLPESDYFGCSICEHYTETDESHIRYGIFCKKNLVFYPFGEMYPVRNEFLSKFDDFVDFQNALVEVFDIDETMAGDIIFFRQTDAILYNLTSITAGKEYVVKIDDENKLFIKDDWGQSFLQSTLWMNKSIRYRLLILLDIIRENAPNYVSFRGLEEAIREANYYHKDPLSLQKRYKDVCDYIYQCYSRYFFNERNEFEDIPEMFYFLKSERKKWHDKFKTHKKIAKEVKDKLSLIPRNWY